MSSPINPIRGLSAWELLSQSEARKWQEFGEHDKNLISPVDFHNDLNYHVSSQSNFVWKYEETSKV